MASPCPCRGCLAAYKQGLLEGEQRALDAAWDHGMEVGTHSALDAAQEAASTQRCKFKARDWDDAIEAVLAAIDGLRGPR